MTGARTGARLRRGRRDDESWRLRRPVVGLQRVEPIVKESLSGRVLDGSVRKALPIKGQPQIGTAVRARNESPENDRTGPVGPECAMRRSDPEHHPGADSPPGHPRLKLAVKS